MARPYLPIPVDFLTGYLLPLEFWHLLIVISFLAAAGYCCCCRRWLDCWVLLSAHFAAAWAFESAIVAAVVIPVTHGMLGSGLNKLANPVASKFQSKRKEKRLNKFMQFSWQYFWLQLPPSFQPAKSCPAGLSISNLMLLINIQREIERETNIIHV